MTKGYEIQNKDIMCVAPDSRLVKLSKSSPAAISGQIGLLSPLRPLDSDKYFEVMSAYNEVIDNAEASDKIDGIGVFAVRRAFEDWNAIPVEEMPKYDVRGSSLPVPGRDEVLTSNYVENVIGKAVHDTNVRARRKAGVEAGVAMAAAGGKFASVDALFNLDEPEYTPTPSEHLKQVETSASEYF